MINFFADHAGVECVTEIISPTTTLSASDVAVKLNPKELRESKQACCARNRA